jgi:argininosuccinate lyase
MILEELTAEQLAEIAPEAPVEALAVLQPAESVRRRESLGGPGPNAMAAQIEHAKSVFAARGFPKIA